MERVIGCFLNTGLCGSLTIAISSLSHTACIIGGSAGGSICREEVIGLVVGIGLPCTTDYNSLMLNGG